ncbi:class I SAM-dependent methyltransferase [Fulvivirgaceae bacterium BMA10]|uniref:Class I SAM-dependent methyltransferase n=1 Tax=Splendidivirga corallicola TaxID=3051826 RepID=A0ABT8KWN4_9BACT|nr:class I SAM-dependent methyltransferase [Fulvivirgaceae bacterium BMA10]
MKDNWTEQDSQKFIDYGEFFVPDRNIQIDVICDLLSASKSLHQVVDLCCGEGKLCEAILKKFDHSTVKGFDLSEEMLSKAKATLGGFKGRFEAIQFDLSNQSWFPKAADSDAFVSSLAIHHLDDQQKATLYKNLYDLLNTEGVLVVADIVKPTRQIGFDIAEKLWDKAVKEKSALEDRQDAIKIFREDGWNYYQDPEADPIDKPSSLFDQLKWLEQAGFKGVDIFWMNAGHAIFAGWK